jgi:hypothetical protein
MAQPLHGQYRMMRAVAAAVVGIPLTACAASPLATARSNNPDVHVDTLFTHDGCTVYRFRDIQYHYYVRCPGAQSAVTRSTLSCGKYCNYEDETPTLSSADR